MRSKGSNKVCHSLFSGLLPIILLFSGSAGATGINIGAGGAISFGSGAIHIGCGDIVNFGTVNLGSSVVEGIDNVFNTGVINGDSGLIKFGGDWSNSGTFEPGTSTVAVVDECGDGNTNFDDSTVFYNLSMTTSSGKTVFIESGAEQEIINDLALQGSPGFYLVLRSSTPGQPTFTSLRQGGTQLIDWIDVQDNHAPESFQHIAPDLPIVFNSVDSGGNLRWFKVLVVPALSAPGTIILVTMILIGVVISRRYYAV